MLNIDQIITESLKNDDKVALRTARLLKAEILKYKTSKGAKPYTDIIEMQIISKMCKQREESILHYKQGGREDLVANEIAEFDWLKALLPKPVTEEELSEWIMNTAMDRNWVGTDDVGSRIMIPKKEMGNLIKQVKNAFPTADGKMISDIVKANLE